MCTFLLYNKYDDLKFKTLSDYRWTDVDAMRNTFALRIWDAIMNPTRSTVNGTRPGHKKELLS